MGGRFRLAVARIFGGISYNLAACAYILALAIVMSVVLPLMMTQGVNEQPTPLESIAVLQYTARANVVTTIVGVVVAFIIGALSLMLLVWVPAKIAKIGSRLAQRISASLFIDPTTGRHMFMSKLLLYGPAIIVLIILYFIFSSELVFQILVAGTSLILAAVLFAALRLVISR